MKKRKLTTKAIRLTPDDKAIESDLENMLRSTGYLFPITPEQVEAFQKAGLNAEVPDDCIDPLAELKKKEKDDQ